jgi:RNA polymerase subunit RPABC4/transcription elongation factor Spt4
MSFNPSFLNNFLLIAAALGGAFLAALWLSLIIWTYRDVRDRVRDPLVYLLLRPPQTMEDEYQHMLAEEALLQAIEERSACPGCGRNTADDWIICPNCYTKLMKTCHACGRLMKLPWSLCPYCGTPEPGKRIEDLTVTDATRGMDVQDEAVYEPDEDSESPPSGLEDLEDLSDEDLISQL